MTVKEYLSTNDVRNVLCWIQGLLTLSVCCVFSECRLHVLSTRLRCKERSGVQLGTAPPHLEERPICQQAQVRASIHY